METRQWDGFFISVSTGERLICGPPPPSFNSTFFHVRLRDFLQAANALGGGGGGSGGGGSAVKSPVLRATPSPR